MYRGTVLQKNRIFEISQLAQSLDITPTMRKSAISKYESIATYLQDHGINCSIYPQGSFALGTVVRPLLKDNYDLDTICELIIEKDETSAKETKESIGQVLKDSEKYGDVQEYDTCWTKEYAEGFNIDIVPAVDEELEKKTTLKAKSTSNFDLIDSTIAITKGTSPQYRWSTSNPKGFIKWFKDINRPFLEYDKENRRQLIFEQNRAIFASVEAIPEEDDRSALQTAIQILKRHRDEYFLRVNSKKKADRPLSAAITTIVASIAQNLPKNLNSLELLKEVTNELRIYAQLADMDQIRFKQKYAALNLISRNHGKWCLLNPANPDENLIDSWNDTTGGQNKAASFFEWISVVVKDFKTLETAEDMEYLATVKTAFGKQLVESNSAFTHYNMAAAQPSTPITVPSKPWKGTEDALHKH